MVEFVVNVDVPDLESAITFYTRAFDFQLGRRLGPEVAELLGASTRLYLLAKGAGSLAFGGAQQSRTYERHWTPVHLDIVVSDIDTALARAVEAGALHEGDTEMHAWGRVATMSDPFGNGFCLIQLIGAGYDEMNS